MAGSPDCSHSGKSFAWLAISFFILGFLFQAEVVLAEVEGVDVNAFDIFPPACAFVNPPPAGWKLWSDPATWGASGVVPGVGPGGAGQAATVPCGMAVLLDVPSLNVTLLKISGHLKVLDDPKLGPITVEANFILVEGQLTIGTPEQHFRGSITFTLTASPSRGELTITRPPAEKTNPRSVGYKVFAVVGGQVHFHGMPGGGSTPAWVRLNKTAYKGDRQISVGGDVGGWPLGGRIVVASTDYNMRQAEELAVTNVTQAASGWVVRFAEPLKYMHWGDALESGYPGRGLNQRAEVALLKRNILIQGSKEPGNFTTEGGHFIVFQTQTPQYIEGVELVNMGQQGTLGRYPLHFHLVGDTHNQSYVRKLSIHHTNQRCVVIHGTHNLLVEENVAFNTSGHCFIVEDGIETGNVLERNLGILTLPVEKLIPTAPGGFNESDNTPSTFWISNPNNTLKGNVAAGAADSGFWYELRQRVRGPSANLPGADNVVPMAIPVHSFVDNVAHSCNVGMRTYPHGYHPLTRDRSDPNTEKTATTDIFFEQFTAYKNRYSGAFFHETQNVVVTNSTFADNAIGVDLNDVQNCRVLDSLVVGFTANVGNPSFCDHKASWVDCLPLDNCTLPMVVLPDQGGRARSLPQPYHVTPIVGVSFGQDTWYWPGVANLVARVAFAGYQPRCDIPAAAISIIGQAFTFFNAAHGVRNLTFAPGTNPFWLDPSLVTSPNPEWFAAKSYALRDWDGSLLGAGTAGFVVTNNTAMLPRKGDGGFDGGCYEKTEWGVFLCRGVCYRTVRVRYIEPGFSNFSSPANTTGSMVVVRRVEDNSTVVLTGNTRGLSFNKTIFIDSSTGLWQRYFYANLVAGPNYTYELQVVGGSLGAAPLEMEVGLMDDTGCREGLRLRVRVADPTQQWTLKTKYNDQKGGLPFPRSCPNSGLSATPPEVTSTYYLCGTATSSSSVLALNLAGVVKPGGLRFITLQRINTGANYCPGVGTCGLFASGALWDYRDDGVEQTDPPFYEKPRVEDGPGGQKVTVNSWAATPDTGWKSGSAPFTAGYASPGATAVAQTSSSSMKRVVTYYFRKVFTVGDPTCYSALQLGWLAVDGHVVYLNGQEVLRANLPDSWNRRQRPDIHNTTYASGARGPYWEKSSIAVRGSGAKGELVAGANFLAIEVHVFQFRGLGFTFDAWLAADYECDEQATRVLESSPWPEARSSSASLSSVAEGPSLSLCLLLFQVFTAVFHTLCS